MVTEKDIHSTLKSLARERHKSPAVEYMTKLLRRRVDRPRRLRSNNRKATHRLKTAYRRARKEDSEIPPLRVWALSHPDGPGWLSRKRA